MILKQLQDLIGDIYDVRITHDVYDFLVTDRRQLPPSARSRGSDEELIVAQPVAGTDAGEVGMSLYLDAALLERLRQADPMERLHDGNVADCWTALEGVSHFLYVAWNAGHDKPVSLLELEMQAEVDKYVASYWLLRRQFPDRFPAELLSILFERTRIDPSLSSGRADLYRHASRYAQRFCRRLDRAFRGAHARAFSQDDGLGAAARTILAELRRFYRLTNARKLAHIERTA
ncbi:MAG TPA: hypothetical protein VGM84_02915 [Steroidobacteraceae bacterium]|jgi:hypothetical protein